MKARLTFALSLLVLLLPGLASAHGPTRQKLTKKIEINAPAAKVWEIVGNFQDMSWHPAVKKTTGKNGNTAAEDDSAATRTLDLGDGKTIDESLFKYSAEQMRYSYRITKVDVAVVPVNNYSAHIMVKDSGDGKTTMIWKGAFYRGYLNNDPPENLNEAAAIKAVTDIYEAGLANVKKLAEGGS